MVDKEHEEKYALTDEEKKEYFIERYKSYYEREFGRIEGINTPDSETNSVGIGFTEEVKDTYNLMSYSKQVTYDIDSKELNNEVFNEYITITHIEDYGLIELADELDDLEVEDYLTDQSLGISLDDVTEAIILSTYTNDKKYINNLVINNHYNIEYNFGNILENKNEILKNINSELPEFFNKNNVKVNKNFIQDNEYKNLVNFQLSHYQSIEENTDLDGNYIIHFNPDIENGSSNIQIYSNYADLWEQNFKNEFIEDFNNFTISEIKKGIKSTNLLERLESKYQEFDFSKKENINNFKTQINEMMEKDYESFIKALVIIENPAITDSELDKSYSEYIKKDISLLNEHFTNNNISELEAYQREWLKEKGLNPEIVNFKFHIEESKLNEDYKELKKDEFELDR